jgi:peptidoglycan/LPS O-acetylase OafA/YrhL
MLEDPRCSRYRSLDMWRGVACLLVIVFHSTYYAESGPVIRFTRWLWIGVPFFFVISGYCIAATCDAERRRGRGVWGYFRRRFRRIFPPFWIFLATTAIVVYATERWFWPGLFSDHHHPIPNPATLNLWNWAGLATLTETWRHNVFGPPGGSFPGHEWTLCYEEQFYAVCGLLLILCPGRFFRGAMIVTALTAIARLAARRNGWEISGFFFDGRWLLFALGILTYHHNNYAKVFGRTAAVLALMIGMAISAANPRNVLHGNSAEYTSGFAFALTLVFTRPWDEAIASSPITAPLSWCGRICYSLYLVHWPVCKAASHALYQLGLRDQWPTVLITVPTCIIASVTIGYVFHRAVERRFLNPPRLTG